MARGEIKPITKRLWDRGLTWSKWASLNGYSKRYAELVGAGKCGVWQTGVAGKIQKSLIEQGFTTKEELESLMEANRDEKSC